MWRFEALLGRAVVCFGLQDAAEKAAAKMIAAAAAAAAAGSSKGKGGKTSPQEPAVSALHKVRVCAQNRRDVVCGNKYHKVVCFGDSMCAAGPGSKSYSRSIHHSWHLSVASTGCRGTPLVGLPRHGCV